MAKEPRDIPGVIVPPPVIALAALLLGLSLDWLLGSYLLWLLLGFGLRLFLGIVLIAGGAALLSLAARLFTRLGTNIPPWKPATALATDGVYRYLRNPMYVGMGLVTAGLALPLASDWTLVLLVPAALLLHYGVVLREERYLERKFGDAYRRYKERVPRYGWPV
jgi:protein-S-isoprenylcysteine O-methyltransferase Ste14